MADTQTKPYHAFTEAGRHYLLNLEAMQAQLVDQHAFDILTDVAGADSSALTGQQRKVLNALQLLRGKGVENKRGAPCVEPVINAALCLTQACNLRCVYCYGSEDSYESGEQMSEATAYQAVDWLIEQAGKKVKIHVGFIGGEPFVRFDLMKRIVSYSKRRCQEAGKRVAFHATSNGTLLDDETIAFIGREEIDVLISMDGPREVHDRQRPFSNGRGSYDTVAENCRKLINVRPDTRAHAVIMGDNDPQVVKGALLDIGFKQVTIAARSASLFDEHKQSKKARDTENALRELAEEAAYWRNLLRDHDDQSLKILKAKSQLYFAIYFLMHNTKRYYGCGAGRAMVGVATNGDVYLCHRFVGKPEYRIGSVYKNQLDRDAFVKPVDFNPKCANCFARYYCGGGCKHDNAGSCGDVYSPNVDLCRLRRRELELAATVVANLSGDDTRFLNQHDIIPPKLCPLDFG